MDGYPEFQFPNFDGNDLDDYELDFSWLDSSIPGPQADVTESNLLQDQLYDSTASALSPERAGNMMQPGNSGVSMPTVTGTDLTLSAFGPGLPIGVMGDDFLQDPSYIGSVSAMWQGVSGDTTYLGSFVASMPEVMPPLGWSSLPDWVPPLEWSSHTSSVLTPPSDWQGTSPSLTPATSTLESPIVGGAYQRNTPSMANGMFSLLPHLPLPLSAPVEEKPKKAKGGKRRKRVARTQREIRKEEKPEVCEQCPRRFANKRDLVRHFEIHKREQGLPTALFKCPHCGTTFTLKHNLTRHLRKKHEDIYPMGTRILH